MFIRLAGFVQESVVDGPGLRFVVFAQGCPRSCEGCHNLHTQDFSGGMKIDIEEILDQIKSSPLLKGVTLSGGEPFAQAGPFAALAEAVRELGMDVITYTGYTWEELIEMAKSDPAVQQLVEASDYIIDGPYVEAQRDIALPFRGSRNQRIIEVQASLSAGKVVLAGWGMADK
jgi:anaerobic ribonucleoside-triphosphate reductase activating protein